MLNKIKSHFEEYEEGYATLAVPLVFAALMIWIHVSGYCDNPWH